MLLPKAPFLMLSLNIYQTRQCVIVRETELNYIYKNRHIKFPSITTIERHVGQLP